MSPAPSNQSKYGRRGMPEIFTDKQACATKTRIERTDRINPGKEAPLIKVPVRRQIYFMMNVKDAPAGEIG